MVKIAEPVDFDEKHKALCDSIINDCNGLLEKVALDCMDSFERDCAFVKLQEFTMWVGKAIAFNQVHADRKEK